MAVAQVPGFNPAAKHRPVIPFGVEHQPRILFGKEEFILRDMSIAVGVISGPLSYFEKLADDFVFTSLVHSKSGSVPVGLRIFAKVLETRIAIARALRCFRVDLVEIMQHRFD